MTRRPLLIVLALACLALLLAAPAAGARSAKVAAGRPALANSANGLASILVPVSYPIELSGRVAKLRVALVAPGGKRIRAWVLHERLNGGKRRLPERRRRFTYVHRVGLDARLSRQARNGATVRVLASGRTDVDGDGEAELRSSDRFAGKASNGRRPQPLCSSLPQLRVRSGGRVSLPLPVCDRARKWRAVGKGAAGKVRVRRGRLIYQAPKGFQGSDGFRIVAKGVRQFGRATVGAPSGVVVRALGDSVTAGFGYYSNGKNFPLDDLFTCEPSKTLFNDACSSNSTSTKAVEGAPEYAPDYGLANDVSWAAQWANEHGITNYKNFAVSGSEPGNWAPGGFLYKYTKQIEAEDPDYLLLTLGANPLLSKLLTSPRDLWCAATSELPEFEACIREEFAKVGLRTNLKNVYAELLSRTAATIYVMQYHLSIPWSALADSTLEIARANQMLNEEVAAVVAEMGNSRMQLVIPPPFDVGIDIAPVHPSTYTCRIYPVDGPSVQSTGTQIELEDHPLSFCSGPAGGGENWVIDNDTGIHPSAAGYRQMASQVPAPK